MKKTFFLVIIIIIVVLFNSCDGYEKKHIKDLIKEVEFAINNDDIEKFEECITPSDRIYLNGDETELYGYLGRNIKIVLNSEIEIYEDDKALVSLIIKGEEEEVEGVTGYFEKVDGKWYLKWDFIYQDELI